MSRVSNMLLATTLAVLLVAGCDRTLENSAGREEISPSVEDKHARLAEYLKNQPYPGKEDFERYEAFHRGVVRTVRTLGLKPGKKKKLGLSAFEVTRPITHSPIDPDAPPVPAYRTGDGSLYVKIETLDLHHAGIHGYVYCEESNPSSLAIEELFLGAGEPGPLTPIADHWYAFRAD